MLSVIKYFGDKILSKENAVAITSTVVVTGVSVFCSTNNPLLFGSILGGAPSFLGFPLSIPTVIGIYASSLAISELFPTIRKKLINPIIARVTYDTWYKFGVKVIKQPHSYQVSKPLGEKIDQSVIARISTGEFVNLSLNNIIPSFLELSSAIGVLFAFSGTTVGCWVLGTTSFSILFNYLTSGHVSEIQKEYIKKRLASGRYNFDLWKNFETIYYFNTMGIELPELKALMDTSQEHEILNLQVPETVSLANSFINQAVFLGLTIYTGNRFANAQSSLRDLSILIYFLRQLSAPLKNLGESINKICAISQELVPVVSLLEQEVVESGKTLLRPPFNSGVEFDNVRFSYDNVTPVLKGLSFTAEPGQLTALVGPSGGGKTTVTRLLYRFYNVLEGSGKIRINGQEINEISMSSLSNNISIVPQNPVLFNSTIKRNVEYGRLSTGYTMNDAALYAALEKVGLLRFVNSFNEGLAKRVGEGGSMLSGGQLQRVAIARAAVRDAFIVLLDEFTSALDPDSEKLIENSLNELLKDKVRIVIAHRLSTIKNADKIVVLNDGKVEEQGTFTTLMAKRPDGSDGFFKQMWDKQQSTLGEEFEIGTKRTAADQKGNLDQKDDKIAAESRTPSDNVSAATTSATTTATAAPITTVSTTAASVSLDLTAALASLTATQSRRTVPPDSANFGNPNTPMAFSATAQQLKEPLVGNNDRNSANSSFGPANSLDSSRKTNQTRIS